MSKQAKKFTPRQIKTLSLLSAGLSPDAVGIEVGVDPRKISSWLNSERFQEELRIAAERARQRFESRVFSLANNSAVIVGDMIKDDKNKDRQLEGVKLAFNAAVRLANRYKELQVEGYVAPTQPLVIFPQGTVFPWKNKAILPPMPLEIPETIDVESEEVDGDESE
jgi:hypothetical protein